MSEATPMTDPTTAPETVREYKHSRRETFIEAREVTEHGVRVVQRVEEVRRHAEAAIAARDDDRVLLVIGPERDPSDRLEISMSGWSIRLTPGLARALAQRLIDVAREIEADAAEVQP